MGGTLARLRVILAQPRGFCAGVDRAVKIVERALASYGAPVYVLHEIVHNKQVVEDLRDRGAVFVERLDQIPEGALTIFSAHGVAQELERDAARRSLDVIDATCPLVQKVHTQGQRYAEQGYDVIVIGDPHHAEVAGTLGRISGTTHVVANVAEAARIEIRNPARVAYVTQTTLAVDDTRDVIAALTRRFPGIVGPDTHDICYATQNRQMAVKALARVCDLILVIGSANSANTNRLREIGEGAGVRSLLVERPESINPAWLANAATVGITAGASAPETLVQEAIRWLKACRTVSIETLHGVEENVRFRLPRRLAAAGRSDGLSPSP